MPKKKTPKSKPKTVSFFDQIKKDQAKADKEHLAEYDTSRGRNMIGKSIDAHEGD